MKGTALFANPEDQGCEFPADGDCALLAGILGNDDTLPAHCCFSTQLQSCDLWLHDEYGNWPSRMPYRPRQRYFSIGNDMVIDTGHRSQWKEFWGSIEVDEPVDLNSIPFPYRVSRCSGGAQLEQLHAVVRQWCEDAPNPEIAAVWERKGNFQWMFSINQVRACTTDYEGDDRLEFASAEATRLLRLYNFPHTKNNVRYLVYRATQDIFARDRVPLPLEWGRGPNRGILVTSLLYALPPFLRRIAPSSERDLLTRVEARYLCPHFGTSRELMKKALHYGAIHESVMLNSQIFCRPDSLRFGTKGSMNRRDPELPHLVARYLNKEITRDELYKRAIANRKKITRGDAIEVRQVKDTVRQEIHRQKCRALLKT